MLARLSALPGEVAGKEGDASSESSDLGEVQRKRKGRKGQNSIRGENEAKPGRGGE